VALAVVLSLTGFLVASLLSSPTPRPRRQATHHPAAHRNKDDATAADRKVTPGPADLFAVPALSSYLASCTDDITAAVYDDVTGQTWLYRPGVAEDMASIIKVDIMATLLEQGQVAHRTLTADEEELSQGMIEESNNDDATDLWNDEGGASAVSSFDAQAGLTETTPNTAGYWGLSTTTASNQVQLLRQIAYPNSLLTDESRDYELGLMTHVDPSQSWGISSGVDPSATVAIKNGWLPLDSGGWQINSIGYVDGDGRDYVVAVLSNGNDTEAAGITTIEGLAALIWKELAPATRT
jgi:beta-lactamase class A